MQEVKNHIGGQPAEAVSVLAQAFDFIGVLACKGKRNRKIKFGSGRQFQTICDTMRVLDPDGEIPAFLLRMSHQIIRLTTAVSNE